MAGSNATASSCLAPMGATSNGVFQHDNPLDFALPLVIIQICLVVILTRVLTFLLRPLRQPRVIAEIVVSDNKFFQDESPVRSESAAENVNFPPREEYCLAHRRWAEARSICIGFSLLGASLCWIRWQI